MFLLFMSVTRGQPIIKMTYAPSEDSDQPGHPPGLIKVFAVRSMGSYMYVHNAYSCGQQRQMPRLI